MAREFSELEMSIIAEAAMPGMDAVHVINTTQFFGVTLVESFYPTLHDSPPVLTRLGHLDKLPPEVLLLIVPHMGVLTAVRFRQVSLRARQIIDSDSKFRVIFTQALEFLQMLFCTGAADEFSIELVYQMLHEDRCAFEGCKRIRSLLNLSGRYRFCTQCFSHHDPESDFGVRSLEAASDILSIPKQAIKQFFPSVISTIPGIYSERQYTQSEPMELISIKHLAEAMAKAEGMEKGDGFDRAAYESKLTNALNKAPWDYSWKYMTVMEMPFLQPHTKPSDYVYTCRYCPELSFTADQLFKHAFECDSGDAYVFILFPDDPDNAVFPEDDDEQEQLELELFGRVLEA